MIGTPLLLGIDAQVTPPPPTDPTFDFASGMPVGTSISRTGNAIYCTSATQYIAAPENTPRLDYDSQGVFNGLMLEPAFTNKVAGENFDGINVGLWTGAQGSELVDDTAALAAQGLSGLVPSGQSQRVTNDSTQCNNDGLTGNTERHSMVVFARLADTAGVGVTGKMSMWDGIGQVQFNSADYEVVSSRNIPPSGNDSRMRMGNVGSPGGARWVGATMVEGDNPPAYPIPGNGATQGLETLSIIEAALPDGEYNVVYDTPNGQFTQYRVTVLDGWSIDGSAFQAICNCSRVRKITFTAPSDPPAPPPTQTTTRRPRGVYGLNGSAEAGEPGPNFFTDTISPCRGWMRRIPWYRIEPQRDVFDWTLADQAVSEAKQKEQELGYPFKVIFYLEDRTYANLQYNPYTTGPPAYIVDNPEEFGGDGTVNPGGPGGMWPSKNIQGSWRPSFYHPAVDARITNYQMAALERYRDESTVVGLVLGESALAIDLSPNSPSGQEFRQFGSGDGYLDRRLQMTRDICENNCPFVIMLQGNFWNGARGGNRQAVFDAIKYLDGLNAELGKDYPIAAYGFPDAVGDGVSNGYASVYAGIDDAIAAGYTAPLIPGLQYFQYTDSTPGPNFKYTLESCTDVAVKRFNKTSIMQWPRIIRRNDANDWFDTLDIYRDSTDPDYIEFRDGVDT